VRSFVRVQRTPDGAAILADDEGPLRFVLGNAFYLMEEAARGRDDIIDETLRKLGALGVRVVRVWAFNDDPGKPERDVARGLDRLLARAAVHGMRLVLPLVNYWDAYGGARQWCRQSGIADAWEGDARFFTDARVRAAFFAHVAALLTRENPETGLRYGDDPTVLAWELMNEPRGIGLTEDELVSWVRDAARVVHANARQLVATGEEGQERSFAGYDERYWRGIGGAHLFEPAQGASFSRHVALPEIDLASVHFYPEKYGLAPGREAEAGEAWIAAHAAIARAAGKPLYVGEIGLGNEHASFARCSLAERRAIYRAWFAAAERAGAAGMGLWVFAYDARPDEWDDFTFYLRDGLPLDAPENRYADLVAEAARRFGARR
jgi:mannan endo-1,4-beta-mannosidase